MPLYEYKCDTCGNVFELRQKFADQPLSVHENCGGKVERLISAPGLHFKGSGWYVTDYGKGGSKPSASNGESKSEKSEKSDKSEKSSGKGESAPKADAPSTTPAPKSNT